MAVPVRRLGSGPPLLVLNGYAATKDDWDPTFLDALAARHELLVPDNPGMGDHREPAETIAANAESARDAMDEAGIGSAPVLGWSMGGFIAQELAATTPERVDALVLLSTDRGGPETVRCEESTWGALTSHEGSPREQAERLLSLILPAEFVAALGPEVVDIVAAGREKLSAEALDGQERAMANWHEAPSTDRVARIGAPTFVAFGSDDRVIPAPNAGLLADAFSGARPDAFAGGGHAFQAQEPVRLAGLISEFLGGTAARTE